MGGSFLFDLRHDQLCALCFGLWGGCVGLRGLSQCEAKQSSQSGCSAPCVWMLLLSQNNDDAAHSHLNYLYLQNCHHGGNKQASKQATRNETQHSTAQHSSQPSLHDGWDGHGLSHVPSKASRNGRCSLPQILARRPLFMCGALGVLDPKNARQPLISASEASNPSLAAAPLDSVVQGSSAVQTFSDPD